MGAERGPDRDRRPGPAVRRHSPQAAMRDGRGARSSTAGRSARARSRGFTAGPAAAGLAGGAGRGRARSSGCSLIRGVTRANTVAVMSPTGGVGKTTCTFVVGNLLAYAPQAARRSPSTGTPRSGRWRGTCCPTAGVPNAASPSCSNDADRLFTAAEVGPYVSRLPTGLHVLAARREHGPGGAARAGLVRRAGGAALLLLRGSCCSTSAPAWSGRSRRSPPARADQIVLVTTPDRTTSDAACSTRSPICDGPSGRRSP